jgi:hypothetical protein
LQNLRVSNFEPGILRVFFQQFQRICVVLVSQASFLFGLVCLRCTRLSSAQLKMMRFSDGKFYQ